MYIKCSGAESRPSLSVEVIVMRREGETIWEFSHFLSRFTTHTYPPSFSGLLRNYALQV